ncbi:MAG: DUF86 domain-containing protein [Dehalococcoidia bacterium]|nr:DUF86 domain-containing protein [Dehalococcoidia bacterium]
MRLESRKYLHDIVQAVELLTRFTSGKSISDYESDPMLRSATERQFEVIGEALAQLARTEARLADQVTDYRRIIAFRNILIHGYAQVDHRLVWDIVESKLPVLRAEVTALLAEDDADPE